MSIRTNRASLTGDTKGRQGSLGPPGAIETRWSLTKPHRMRGLSELCSSVANGCGAMPRFGDGGGGSGRLQPARVCGHPAARACSIPGGSRPNGLACSWSTAQLDSGRLSAALARLAALLLLAIPEHWSSSRLAMRAKALKSSVRQAVRCSRRRPRGREGRGSNRPPESREPMRAVL
jgi:hypothetical protein